MKILNWNISWSNSILPKIEYLENKVRGESFVMILQEVKPYFFDVIKEGFLNIANVEYSLTYRAPGKYDNDSRKLGIVILTSKDIEIKKAFVIDRAIMPDRTIVVDVVLDNTPIRIMGLHSVTGCNYSKAKEIQYFTFAEAVEEYKPDIVGIDANEPEVDSYDISKMKFYDNYQKGEGCKTFFEIMKQNSLVDSFVKNYNINDYVEGDPLATSHIIKRGNKKVRYDFLFLNKEKFSKYLCEYEYESAVKAGSDHAMVMVTIEK